MKRNNKNTKQSQKNASRSLVAADNAANPMRRIEAKVDQLGLVVRKPGAPQPVPRPVMKVQKEHVERVCGIVDPFCHAASGAKYPDVSSVKTLPYTRRLRYTLSSDATGYANLLIAPQYSYYPYAAVNVYSGTAVTSWANYSAYPVIAGVANYRIVSAGFVVRHVVSPLNSAGMVYLRQYGVESGSSMAPIETTIYNATSVANVPVQECKEIAAVLQHNSQMPQNFYKVAGDVAQVGNQDARGYTFATVSVAGAPANTPILEFEFVINFELIFEDGSDLAQVATAAPPASNLITNAAAHVTSTMQPIVNQGIAALGKAVFNRAATAIAGYIAGPAGASAARMAITVD